MSLPKIDKPLYTLTIPSSGKEIRYRPFLVKEEKLLLMAAEGKDQREILQTVKQIINNCVVDLDFDINDLAFFDIEYFFVNLRSKSVGNIIQIKVNDPDLDIPITVDLDLDDVVMRNMGKPPLIRLSDTMSLQLRYPKADFAEKIEITDSYSKNIFEIITYLLDKLYDGDDVYQFSEYTRKEVDEFVESLPVNVITEVDNFLKNMPSIHCTVDYYVGEEARKVELNNLSDFFILG
jgi:hypothetical protein